MFLQIKKKAKEYEIIKKMITQRKNLIYDNN